ncbi:MAG: anti-sigma B factor antagonist [Cyclobacteriaceae bacterium]|jgi:anti-sigma B factor antagonist
MVNIDIAKEHDIQLITVVGEIDASSSIELDDALRSASDEGSGIIINLEGLDYISSAGLGVFISYIDELKTKKILFILFGMQPAVKEVFDILGLNQIMTIVTDKDEAIKIANEI